MNAIVNEQTKIKRKKSVNNRFDELTKNMAQSVTRRAALKKFGLGLAGMGLACFLILVFSFVVAPVGFAAVLVVTALIVNRALAEFRIPRSYQISDRMPSLSE